MAPTLTALGLFSSLLATTSAFPVPFSPKLLSIRQFGTFSFGGAVPNVVLNIPVVASAPSILPALTTSVAATQEFPDVTPASDFLTLETPPLNLESLPSIAEQPLTTAEILLPPPGIPAEPSISDAVPDAGETMATSMGVPISEGPLADETVATSMGVPISETLPADGETEATSMGVPIGEPVPSANETVATSMGVPLDEAGLAEDIVPTSMGVPLDEANLPEDASTPNFDAPEIPSPESLLPPEAAVPPSLDELLALEVPPVDLGIVPASEPAPEGLAPEVPASEITAPEVAASETPVPEVVVPEITTPEVSAPEPPPPVDLTSTTSRLNPSANPPYRLYSLLSTPTEISFLLSDPNPSAPIDSGAAPGAPVRCAATFATDQGTLDLTKIPYEPLACVDVVTGIPSSSSLWAWQVVDYAGPGLFRLRVWHGYIDPRYVSPPSCYSKEHEAEAMNRTGPCRVTENGTEQFCNTNFYGEHSVDAMLGDVVCDASRLSCESPGFIEIPVVSVVA